jgi:hypothetical protein
LQAGTAEKAGRQECRSDHEGRQAGRQGIAGWQAGQSWQADRQK